MMKMAERPIEAYSDRCINCGHPRFKHTGAGGPHKNGCELCVCPVYKSITRDPKEVKPEKLG